MSKAKVCKCGHTKGVHHLSHYENGIRHPTKIAFECEWDGCDCSKFEMVEEKAWGNKFGVVNE